MSKIDTKNRKEFRVGDFFEIQKNELKLSNKDLSDSGNIPVYSSLTNNNGIFGYTNKTPEYITDEKTPFFIVFGDHTKSMHIASGSFCVMDNVKVLKPLIYNSDIVRFILTVWNASIPDLGYSRHRNVAKQSEFFLPVDSEGNPDREYMENYMKNLEEKCKTKLQNLILARGGIVRLINTNLWKEFKVGDLFEIINGKGITKEELFLNPGKIIAIQSGEENNGCIGFIDEKYCIEKGYYIESNPCLTVARSGSSGHITVQNKPFVVGDSAKILKSYYSLNIYQLVFFKSILMQLKKKYSYNDKVSEKRYQEETIKLPVDSEGDPNREFMENYIKNLMEKNEEKLKCLV